MISLLQIWFLRLSPSRFSRRWCSLASFSLWEGWKTSSLTDFKIRFWINYHKFRCLVRKGESGRKRWRQFSGSCSEGRYGSWVTWLKCGAEMERKRWSSLGCEFAWSKRELGMKMEFKGERSRADVGSVQKLRHKLEMNRGLYTNSATQICFWFLIWFEFKEI